MALPTTRSLAEVALERGFVAGFATSRTFNVGVDPSALLENLTETRVDSAAPDSKEETPRGSRIRTVLAELFQLVIQLSKTTTNCIFVLTESSSFGGMPVTRRDWENISAIIHASGFHYHVAPGDVNSELSEMSRRGVIDMILTGDQDSIEAGGVCVACVNWERSHFLSQEIVLDVYDGRHLHGTSNSIGATSWSKSSQGPSAMPTWRPLIQNIGALAECCSSVLNWGEQAILTYFEEQVYPGAVVRILSSKRVLYDYREGILIAGDLQLSNSARAKPVVMQTTLLDPKPKLPLRILNPRRFDPHATTLASFSTAFFVTTVLEALGMTDLYVPGDIHNSSIRLAVPMILLFAAANPGRYGHVVKPQKKSLSTRFHLLQGSPTLEEMTSSRHRYM
ncbi:hypothetical protein V5O48_003776 [Marasmius crinis-equi]|uniref:XPG-I domain-containing protein n=1 Tax=Marasmius crinis-equi TaxID=585013 RepID=A0ABR3FSM5_9AGAR